MADLLALAVELLQALLLILGLCLKLILMLLPTGCDLLGSVASVLIPFQLHPITAYSMLQRRNA